jgi:hypothetical protein
VVALSCAIGRHLVEDCGIRNGKYEFARCGRCSCDLMRSNGNWKRVPKGFKVVWKPKGAGVSAGPAAGSAAIARQVDLHGVTVVGERSYGSQRFALVVLNGRDQRSYRGMVDQLGTSARISQEMEKRTRLPKPSSIKRPAEQPKRIQDMVGKLSPDAFEWEQAYVAPSGVRRNG